MAKNDRWSWYKVENAKSHDKIEILQLVLPNEWNFESKSS